MILHGSYLTQYLLSQAESNCHLKWHPHNFMNIQFSDLWVSWLATQNVQPACLHKRIPGNTLCAAFKLLPAHCIVCVRVWLSVFMHHQMHVRMVYAWYTA